MSVRLASLTIRGDHQLTMQKTRAHHGSLPPTLLTVLLLLIAAGGASGRLPAGTDQPLLSIHTDDLFRLADSAGAGNSPAGLYEVIQQIAFPQPLFDSQSLIAFEENQRFVYAVAVAPKLV